MVYFIFERMVYLEALHGIINAINNVLWSYVLILVLVGIGIWFTLRTKFVQLRMLPEMLRLLTEGIGAKTEDKQISTFQAFCVSTASRVGVGNIAGVAIAIVTGGPGAVFWMWFIAMSFFIGGKIANVMTKIGNVENRGITEKHRVKFILLKILGFIVRTLIRCAILCWKVFFSTFNYIKKLKKIKNDT